MILETVLTGELELELEQLELLPPGVVGPLAELLLELEVLVQLPEPLAEPTNASLLPPQAASMSASAETAKIEAILCMTHPVIRFVPYRPCLGRSFSRRSPLRGRSSA